MANQIASNTYEYTIFGDGVSTSVSFDLKHIFSNPSQDELLQLNNPDSIYFQSLNGPTPIPNVLSSEVQGSVITFNFDSPFVAYDPINQAQYTITFLLGFNS